MSSSASDLQRRGSGRSGSATAPIGRRYDELAAEYDTRWSGYVAATLKLVTDVIPLEASANILDAPCGTGAFAERIHHALPAARIVGIDASLAMLAQARLKKIDSTTAWLQGDVARLPFASSAFDWVICANSLHYFPEPAAALAEFFRVVRPGGRLVLVDWSDDYLTCKLLSGWLKRTEPGFVRTYSTRDCRRVVEQAGFRVVDETRMRIGWMWGMMRFVGERPPSASP